MTQHVTPEITRARWRRAFAVCEAAAALPVNEREAYLQTACAKDPALLQAARNLLHAETEAETSDFLETPPQLPAAKTVVPETTLIDPFTEPHAAVGQQAGAYRLTRFLERGGMGEVYLAKRADGMFDRKVAVKLIRADLNEKEYRRFRREVQILADLKHPNLVTLHDAGRMKDGRPYLVMEYVEGDNLRDWLKTQPTPPRDTVAEIARQACAGLHAAHQAGVIHRDIKPANLILAEQNDALTVKLLDFGIAYRRELLQTGESQTGGAIGTAGYMSPEQLNGARADELQPASDVYSIALVVYEMLTGQQAYAGYSQAEIIAKRFYQSLPPPSARRPDLGYTASLDAVLMKALAAAPGDRYATPLEFVRALTEALRETAPLTGSSPTPVPAPVPVPQPVDGGDDKEERGYGWSRWVAGVFALLVFGVAGWWGWLRQPAASTQPLPTASTPQPTPTPAVKGLQIRLGIQRPQGMPFDGCQFVLFNPGVLEPSNPLNRDDALVILKDVGADGHSHVEKQELAPPGQYLMQFKCQNFKTVTQQVTVAEDQKRPGWATVSFEITPR